MTKRFKNIIFDCDSTLTKIEGLDEIAKRKGIDGEVLRITAAGMNGDLPFSQSLRRRLEIVQPSREDLVWLGRRYIEEVVEDATMVIAELLRRDYQVCILTGALYPAVKVLASYLGIDRGNVYAIGFKGLDPEGSNPIDSFGWGRLDTFKVETVKRISQAGPTVLVGDGMTDFEAGQHADLFIGFGGVVVRPKLKELCQYYIEEPRLQKVLDYVL